MNAIEKNDFKLLGGNIRLITGVELVDQKPIGRSSRSNPATYVKAYDYIRELYAETNYSLTHGLKPSDFSFNVPGGRCEVCQGEGYITVEMQFMADIQLKCEECHGKRFTPETLESKFKNVNISELLSMTIDEVLTFFENENHALVTFDDKRRKQNSRIHHILKNIIARLKPLQDVGLGYLGLGQSSATLSGGEAQRVKLGYYLGQLNKEYNHFVFIFDEPTTGLHFHDVDKLLRAIQALVNQGNTVIVIEHNLDVIKSADWVIDLGPEGGDEGGYLLFTGTPDEMVKLENNSTAEYLKRKLK